MLAGGVEAARQPHPHLPVNPGKPENADQCVGPKTRQKNSPRDPCFVTETQLGRGGAALVKCDAVELERFL